MEPPDDTTDTSSDDAASAAGDQSTNQEDDTGGFVFDQDLEPGDDQEQSVDLAEREQERVVDLVRLQPTKNAELQEQWGLDSGSEVHHYLESELKDYYYRDDDGYIRATDTAEAFAQEHQDVYQDVTQPDDEPEEAPDLQRRDLVIALVTLTQELGYLPSPEEVNTHGEYRHQRYREEFGDLFNAFQAAGILPDDVTRSDFYGEDELEAEGEAEAESVSVSEAGQDGQTAEAEESEEEEPEEDRGIEPVELDVTEIDVDRPNFQVPEDADESHLIGEIRRFADILGEPPTEELVAAYGRFPADVYQETFGSWRDAVTSAGCDPEDLPDMSNRRFTNVEVLDVIGAVADELGRPPTTIETGKRAPFSYGLGSARFGSWATALELAGLDPSERPSVDSGGDGDHEGESTEEPRDDVEFTVDATFCDDCGSVMVPDGGYWLCESCGRQQPKEGQTQREQPDPTTGSSHQEPSEPSTDPAQQEAAESGPMVGPVVFFNDAAGYGFIEHDSVDDDVFFHMEELGGPDVQEGQKLQFELTFTDEGPRAKNPQRVEESSTDTIDEKSSEGSSEATQTEPSRQELLDEIRRLDKSLDRIPYESDMNQDGQFTAYTYRDRFGSWDDALAAAGIDKEAALLEDMQQVADTVDGELTQPTMNHNGKYSASMAARYFGSWSDAKERLEEWEATETAEAATETDASEPAEEAEEETPSREALLEELERLDASLERIPYPSDMNEDGAFTAHDYQEEFESWDDALAAIGVDKEAELLAELQRVTEKLGKKPSSTEMSEHGEYSFGMYANFFESWGAAKDRLDEWESDEPPQPAQESGETVQQEGEGEEERGAEDEEENEDDPIGSVIDETLEEMMQSDDDDSL